MTTMDELQTRTRNIFDPASPEPYPLSRSKLQLFLDCPRCFYLDRRNGIGRPDGPPFSLNLAVDALLKREFDDYRAQQKPHPLMVAFGAEAVPFQDARLNDWRDMQKGIRVNHHSGFQVFGAVDDVWMGHGRELFIVDYKATSTERTITLDDEWKDGYKRQMEIYQWLLRGLGEHVSNRGYFVFANADKSRIAFDAKLQFGLSIVPYDGTSDWIDDALLAAHACLCESIAPPSTYDCEWCFYRKSAWSTEQSVTQ